MKSFKFNLYWGFWVLVFSHVSTNQELIAKTGNKLISGAHGTYLLKKGMYCFEGVFRMIKDMEKEKTHAAKSEDPKRCTVFPVSGPFG